jgi:L-aspartate oxidase
VRPVASRALGVLRGADGLGAAAGSLLPLAVGGGGAADAAAIALMIAVAAHHRAESRGAHYRTDFPAADPAWRRRVRWRLDDAVAAAHAIACEAIVPDELLRQEA